MKISILGAGHVGGTLGRGVHLALSRGLGRDFAFGLLRRTGNSP